MKGFTQFLHIYIYCEPLQKCLFLFVVLFVYLFLFVCLLFSSVMIIEVVSVLYWKIMDNSWVIR